jgi:phospholipid/cholesterol/gamma-HCH transport system substrate-binding protein
MLTRSVRVKLVAFVAVGLVLLLYIGVRYVGLTQWIGVSGYTVHLDLADGGGIFTNAEVDYRGVPVGRVGGMELTRAGIQVDLDISSGRPIPNDVQAVVADLSVIGEQYVDLRPRRTSGPYLHNGSAIAQSNTQVPPPIGDLLLSTDQLVQSIPLGSLQTTLSELYDATQGIGSELSTLASSSDTFVSRLNTALPQTVDLITSSRTVLATQNDEATAIRQFAQNLDNIWAQLKSSNGDISTVLAGIAPAATEVSGLFDQIHGSLHDLLSNLLTTSVVFYQQRDAVRDVLVNLPVAVTIGGLVTTPQGINVGLVPTFFDPLPCTQGYGGTKVRTGLDTAGNPPLNTAAGCTAMTGTDLRGSPHSPTAGK